MYGRGQGTQTSTGRLGIVLVSVAIASLGCRGRHEGAGAVTQAPVPAGVVAARTARQAEAAEALVMDESAADAAGKQILFGDLHVHTTFSTDAFLRSLPMLQGEGAHPPADACDFARFCADLDFWAITDHAESISPQHWRETKESIRQCNAVTGDPRNPDVVAFVGWEWTQVGRTPDDHYGHENVIFRDASEDRLPLRPISAFSPGSVAALQASAAFWDRIRLPLSDPGRQRSLDFSVHQAELREAPLCPSNIDTRELPSECHETAQTPAELHEKLSQWGFDTIVIPHGTTWGLYTPANSTSDRQLASPQYDPEKQVLFEVYSGHGNSEEYRDWQAVVRDGDGRPTCPPPTTDYLPCCWQAGELIRARCSGVPAEACERRVTAARQNYIDAGVAGHLTVPGATVEDWKDCGQCRDCFNPAFSYRPANSAQYALAITNFDDPAHPRRFRFGFVASSDTHAARPGAGYKEFGRRLMTDAAGARDPEWRERLAAPAVAAGPESVPFDPATTALQDFQIVETERQASFFMTGGLVAVHAAGRDRDAIWAALKRREVYATSGDRILLWFDLLNGPDGPLPMGSETAIERNPVFRVRAVGALQQLLGCPAHSVNALSPERLARLCRSECYNPSDGRRLITRIEIVRIKPQQRPGEPVRSLIQDPWRRFECPGEPEGCVVEFEDPGFVAGGREAIYYARAVQEPTLAVNAGGLRCQSDEAGACIGVNPCYGDYRTPYEDDCLAPNEERAWSSPIYVGFGAAG